MHGDEAVNAIKYSQLSESGKFDYDPVEYHGPTLYYFTLPVSWISGRTSLKDLNEIILRIVPVVFGIGLILLVFILKPHFGWRIPALAGLLTAVSPAFVFFSRYYIHEMLLVFFCYLFIFSYYRYIKNNNIVWLLISSLAVGLMVSTKETWSILLISMLISVAVVFFSSGDRRKELFGFVRARNVKDILLFFLILSVTIIMFYSSFFTHPDGLENVLSAFSVYIDRAGNSEAHIHPWYMYFKWLWFFGSSDGTFWSEGIIAFFAFFGIIGILSKKYGKQGNNEFGYFLLMFVIITTVIFSIIPYKTPWNLLTFWYGFILLAAIGMVYLFGLLRNKNYQIAFFIISFFAVGYLGWQSYHLNYQKYSDISNPYVYSHPVSDVFDITNRLEQIASRHQEGHQVYIQIMAKDSDYWPLPWYLRNFDRIGWWNQIDFETESAPIIITDPTMIDVLIKKLYEIPPPGQRPLYLPLFEDYTELRPGKELLGYIRKDLWDVLYGQDDRLEIPVKE
jgi:uncharacterized protein (TIGR03663 family)